jgi:hypothetical protein
MFGEFRNNGWSIFGPEEDLYLNTKREIIERAVERCHAEWVIKLVWVVWL